MDKVLTAIGTIPIPMLRHIAKSAVEALVYLSEELGMVHRDVRPACIFLNSHGEVKLGGFQLSTGLDSLSASSSAETEIRVARYYSPCRVVGMPPSSRGDLWSLGISLLEMALGKHPYADHQTYADLLDAISRGPVPTVPDTVDFTPSFRAMIEQCLGLVWEPQVSLRGFQVSHWQPTTGSTD